MRRGNGILIAQIKCGGARVQWQVICESQKQGLLSSMGRVQTGRVARPEKQENEEECDPCAGSSANSSCPHPIQGWGRPAPVMQLEATGYPSPSSKGLDLSSSQVTILEVRKVPICAYSPSTCGRSASGGGGQGEPRCRLQPKACLRQACPWTCSTELVPSEASAPPQTSGVRITMLTSAPGELHKC